MVYNPDKPQQERELERWYSNFVTRQGLKENQCLIFAHHKPNTPQVPLNPPSCKPVKWRLCVELQGKGRDAGTQLFLWFWYSITSFYIHTAQKLSGVQCIHTDLEADPDSVREEFSGFLVTLLTSWQDKQEKEEQGIISAQH